MPITVLKNKPLYDGWYRADIGRLAVKIPNATRYVSIGRDETDHIVLLMSTKQRADMVDTNITANGYVRLNLFNFKYTLPDTNANVIAVAKGYDISNDAYIYQLKFM
jgi:hypothetical protein